MRGVGSWLPVNGYEKSVEPYLCLFSHQRFLQDPTNKNKHITPTPNMNSHQTEQSTEGRSAGGIYISQRAFTAFLLWVCEILQDFWWPKQALINAFIICPPILRRGATAIESSDLCVCKGTTFFSFVQILYTKTTKLAYWKQFFNRVARRG